MTTIFSGIAYLVKAIFIAPFFILITLTSVGVATLNSVSFDAQEKQLTASLPAPQMQASYICSNVQGDTRWQIWSNSYVTKGNPSIGAAPQIQKAAEVRLVINGQTAFSTGPTGRILLPQNFVTSIHSFSTSPSDALTLISNLAQPESPGTLVLQSCLLAHTDEISKLLGFEYWPSGQTGSGQPAQLEIDLVK